MKKLLIGMLATIAMTSFASDLKSEEIRVGKKAIYFDLSLMSYLEGEITAIYSDGSVKISRGEKYVTSVVRSIKKIGIETNSRCYEEFCVGDKVRHFNINTMSNFDTEVINTYDNGYLKIDYNDGYLTELKKAKKFKRKL